jgi:hypothetical protein
MTACAPPFLTSTAISATTAGFLKFTSFSYLEEVDKEVA